MASKSVDVVLKALKPLVPRPQKIDIPAPLDVSIISHTPSEQLSTRRIRIFKYAKNAMQSATYNTRQWSIELQTCERWENPLMGWTSTADPLSNLTIKFDSCEEAAKFCEKNGWYYFIDEPVSERKPIKKSYADNFAWNKRTRVSSK